MKETSSDLLALANNMMIPIIIAFISFYIAKKQITNAGVTQFRQKWIDNLRESISTFIAKAEMISMLDLRDDKSYFEHFKELAQTHNRIELMLNPNELNHNEILETVSEIRDLIHNDKMTEKLLTKKLDAATSRLLTIAKIVLKEEWIRVKQGK